MEDKTWQLRSVSSGRGNRIEGVKKAVELLKSNPFQGKFVMLQT